MDLNNVIGEYYIYANCKKIFIFIEKLWYFEYYQKPRQLKMIQEQATQDEV